MFKAGSSPGHLPSALSAEIEAENPTVMSLRVSISPKGVVRGLQVISGLCGSLRRAVGLTFNTEDTAPARYSPLCAILAP